MTAQPEPAAIPGAPVETVFSAADPRSTWNIVRHIEADPPDWVLLQYNPFSYGRWGLNLHLPLVMLQIKRRCPDVRVAIMAHEIYVPFGVTWQFRVMTLWQRPQFAALSRIADALFFLIRVILFILQGRAGLLKQRGKLTMYSHKNDTVPQNIPAPTLAHSKTGGSGLS